MYMMENTNRMQQGVSEASPPACILYIILLSDTATYYGLVIVVL